jgi:hypothetical protein
MSARLDKFIALSRIKVDPALAQRWDYDARTSGEKHIKQQISQAKRTATMLQKAITQFSNIRPEQELAMKAAASAMQTLAKELVPMVAWAKAYKEFCEAEYKRERAEELEAIAEARWGSDPSALQFEVDLIQELNTDEGRLSFAEWIHSINEHTDVTIKRIRPCFDRILDGKTLREGMAATVHENKRSTDNKWAAMDGLTVICSWQTHELYLAHRKEIAAKTKGILKGFSA